jgi:hypothetical protein
MKYLCMFRALVRQLEHFTTLSRRWIISYTTLKSEGVSLAVPFLWLALILAG